MRLRAILFAIVALGGAGFGAYRLADLAAARVERETRADLGQALAAAGDAWVRLDTDGLIVTIAGEAPDETTRVQALGIARQLVDDRRIADHTTVRAAKPPTPPDFAVELLRNEGAVSLIGLIPDADGRAAIEAGLARAGLAGAVTDMLETADQPAPEAWSDSLAFGLGLLAELPRARISVGTGHVGVIAVAENDGDRRALEARLRAGRPASVRLDLQISAPRPVIAPFKVDFSYAEGKGSFAACSAETVADVVEIGVAAHRVGFDGQPDCQVGLGAPSPAWAAAVARGLAALREMGGGRFVLSDIDAQLTGPDSIAPDRLAEVAARLDADLPDLFSLTVVPAFAPVAAPPPAAAPRFDAVLAGDGTVELGGALQDDTSRDAVQSYASALFGHDRVRNSTVIDASLPEGWPARVLVGMAALAELKRGELQVTPDRVSLQGTGAAADTGAKVEALLAAKIGGGAAVDIGYDPATAAKAAIVTIPGTEAPQSCAEDIAAILKSGSIQFAPGSAAIEPESQGVILAIADVLRSCPQASFEIAGHTDSQGSADYNRQLSQQRADAVAAALRKVGLPDITLTAAGYGAERPIADNGAEAGRAQNRRIEFSPVAAPVAAAANSQPTEARYGPQ